MDFSVERIRREWSKIDDFTGPVTNARYTAWLSPDKKLMAVVHEADDELASVVDVKTWDFVYASPQTYRGALVLELLLARALKRRIFG